MGAPKALELSAKQIAFVNHPDALLDPRKACADIGYSESFCNNSKPYELRQHHIHVLVEKMRERLEKISITPDWVKNEVVVLARSAPADFLTFIDDAVTGNQYTVLKKREDIPDDKWRAAVKSLKFDTYIDDKGALHSRVSEIKFFDRQKALMDLAELLGMTNPEVMLASAAAQAAAQQTEEQKVLEAMTEEELEAIARAHEAASERVRKKASGKRDRKAITVSAGKVDAKD